MRKREDAEYMDEFFKSEYGDYGRMKLAANITRLLSALPDNQLISFRWDMGTCFPTAVLGEGGYLVNHQKSIRKLALITEVGCHYGAPPLKEFTNLQELSWKGLFTHHDCAALRAFLDLYHERLSSLDVDFTDWAEVESRFDLPDDDDDGDNNGDSTPLTELILPNRKNEFKNFLPNLRILSLSAASFKGPWGRLIDAFHLPSVKELKLLNCKLAVELLYYMTRTNISLRATRVELSLRRPELYGTEFDMIDFLAPFDSLEDLFLMFDFDFADMFYFEMILCHRDTLL